MAELALLGGERAVKGELPGWPVFDDQEVEAVREVAASGEWWMDNPVVEAFKAEFGAMQGAEYVVPVTNGTHALEVILRAIGVGPGDEVIVPAYTFVATATSVLTTGGVPIIADVDLDTMTLSPEAFRAAITPRTRAVSYVHLAGAFGRFDEILAIAEAHGIPVVEDAAHAHGGIYKGRPAGSMGIAGAFSFQASKTVASGEGGAITTNNLDVYDKCWSLHNCGRHPREAWYQHYMLGANYRMTPFQAAILRVQIQRLQEHIPHYMGSIRMLDEGLNAIDGITTQRRDPANTTPGCIYVMRYEPEAFAGIPRARLLEALRAEGVPVTGGYTPLHRIHLFTERTFGPAGASIDTDAAGRPLPDYAGTTLPNAEKLATSGMWMAHQYLLGSPEQMAQIVEAFEKVKANADKLAAAAQPT